MFMNRRRNNGGLPDVLSFETIKMGGCTLLLFMIVGAFTWTYSINTWLVFAGKPPTVLWWHGALLGITPYIGKFSPVFAAITFVVMLFL